MKIFLIAGLLVAALCGTCQAQSFGIAGNKSCKWGTGGCGFDPVASATAHTLQGGIAGQVQSGSAGTLSAPGSSYTNYSIGSQNIISATGGSRVSAGQTSMNSGGIAAKGIFSRNISNSN